MRIMMIATVLTALMSTPVMAADKGTAISGESSISGTKVSKGSIVGPEAGNIDNEDKVKKPKKVSPKNDSITDQSQEKTVTKPVTAANPYDGGVKDIPAQTEKSEIDSDGNDKSPSAPPSSVPTNGSAIDSDGNPAMTASPSSSAEGDIHSIHR